MAHQTSIRSLLIATAVIALWLFSHQVHASIAYLFSSWFFLVALSVATRSLGVLFWLPLLHSINYVLWFFMLPLPPNPLLLLVQETIVPIGAAIASFLSILAFISTKRVSTFHSKKTRRRMFLACVRSSTLAGFYAGLMLGLPMVTALFISRIPSPYYLVYVAFFGIGMPIVIGALGAFSGIGFAFVFDILRSPKVDPSGCQPTVG